MQANTSIRIGTGKAILQISLDRTSHLCQLASYLMMSPSLQVYFQQKVIIRLTYQPIVQDSLFTLRHFLIISITLILLLIAHQIVHQFSFRLLRGILYDSPVSLLHLTGFEHFIEAGQRLAGLGKYNKTAHGAVQPVGNTDEDITGFLVFLLQILLYGFRKRRIPRLVSLNDLGSGLVDYNDMIVLVYDSQTLSYIFIPPST